MLRHQPDRHHLELHAVGDEIHDAGRLSTVGHAHGIDLRGVEHDHGVEVLRGADARVRVVQHAGVLQRVVDELLHRRDRHARMHGQDGGRPHGGRNRHEALLAPAQVLHARVGHGRGAEERPRVAVGLRARDLVPCRIAVGAGLGLDDDGLPPRLLQTLGDDARHDVDDAARGIGQDHVDAARGKVALGGRSGAGQKKREAREHDGACAGPLQGG